MPESFNAQAFRRKNSGYLYFLVVSAAMVLIQQIR